MIKRVTVVHARFSTDRAEVLRYRKDVHGPLIAKVPGVKRYVWRTAMADAATFMDMDRVVAGWAEEHQIV
jgi:hypothetical protein